MHQLHRLCFSRELCLPRMSFGLEMFLVDTQCPHSVCAEASTSILHLHLNQCVSLVEFDRHMLLVISRALTVKSKLAMICDISLLL